MLNVLGLNSCANAFNCLCKKKFKKLLLKIVVPSTFTFKNSIDIKPISFDRERHFVGHFQVGKFKAFYDFFTFGGKRAFFTFYPAKCNMPYISLRCRC